MEKIHWGEEKARIQMCGDGANRAYKWRVFLTKKGGRKKNKKDKLQPGGCYNQGGGNEKLRARGGSRQRPLEMS